MNHSRSNFGETSSVNGAQSSLSTARQQSDDSAPPPRWGLLVVVIVAALATASWVGSELPSADADMAQTRAAQAPGK